MRAVLVHQELDEGESKMPESASDKGKKKILMRNP